MKIKLFAICIVLLVLSCKKDSKELNNEAQLQELSKKFYLKTVSSLPSNVKALDFPSVDSLEKYLSKKRTGIQKTPQTVPLNSSKNKTMAGPIIYNTATCDGTGSISITPDYYNQIFTYGGHFVSPYFYSIQFPFAFKIDWVLNISSSTTISALLSILFNPSTNYWSYWQTAGTVNGTFQQAQNIVITGYYDEYYSVGGSTVQKQFIMGVDCYYSGYGQTIDACVSFREVI